MTSIESVTLEVADPTAANALLHRRLRPGHAGTPAGLGGADERLPRVHAVARGVPAGDRQQPLRRRPRRRRHAAEAGHEVVVGLRRRRTGPGRDDLEGRDLVEEGHRSGHPARSTRWCSCWASRTWPRPSGSTSSRASPWRRASAASTSSSTRRRVPSSWRCTGAGPAKDAGVAADGSGSHRLIIGGDAGPFTDPDGFAWEPATDEHDDDIWPREVVTTWLESKNLQRRARRSPPERSTGKASEGFTAEERAAMQGARTGS